MNTRKRIAALASRKEMITYTKLVYEAFTLAQRTMEISVFPPKNMPFFEVYVPTGKFRVHVFPRYQHPEEFCVRFTFSDPEINRDLTVKVLKMTAGTHQALGPVLLTLLSEVRRIRKAQQEQKKKAQVIKDREDLLASAKTIIAEAGANLKVKSVLVYDHGLVRVDFGHGIGYCICNLYVLHNVVKAYTS